MLIAGHGEWLGGILIGKSVGNTKGIHSPTLE